MKPSNIIGIGLIAIFGLAIIYWIISNFMEIDREEETFIQTDIAGILVNIKENTDHGFSLIQVRQPGEPQPLQFELPLSSFVRKYNIEPGDSIFKPGGERVVRFYKKMDIGFELCCTLEY